MSKVSDTNMELDELNEQTNTKERANLATGLNSPNKKIYQTCFY